MQLVKRTAAEPLIDAGATNIVRRRQHWRLQRAAALCGWTSAGRDTPGTGAAARALSGVGGSCLHPLPRVNCLTGRVREQERTSPAAMLRSTCVRCITARSAAFLACAHHVLISVLEFYVVRLRRITSEAYSPHLGAISARRAELVRSRAAGQAPRYAKKGVSERDETMIRTL